MAHPEVDPNLEIDHCVSEKRAAAVLGVSIALLRKWRRTGGGPPYLRIGKLVRYRLSALRNFMDSCVVDPTARREQ